MLIIWKNKGIMVIVYVIVCLIGIVVLNGLIKTSIPFEYDFDIPFGIALLLAGLWTYLTGEEYYKKDGEKIKLDIDNRFFFIPMKKFGLVLLVIGALTLISGIIDTVDKL